MSHEHPQVPRGHRRRVTSPCLPRRSTRMKAITFTVPPSTSTCTDPSSTSSWNASGSRTSSPQPQRKRRRRRTDLEPALSTTGLLLEQCAAGTPSPSPSEAGAGAGSVTPIACVSCVPKAVLLRKPAPSQAETRHRSRGLPRAWSHPSIASSRPQRDWCIPRPLPKEQSEGLTAVKKLALASRLSSSSVKTHPRQQLPPRPIEPRHGDNYSTIIVTVLVHRVACSFL